MYHKLVDHAVFLFVAFFVHLFSVYHLVGVVLLDVLYCSGNVEQSDYIRV